MIVDASAILAIIFQEPGYENVLDRLLSADNPAAGAPTLVEAGIALQARLGSSADGMLERFLDELGIQELPFHEIHWREAVDAYRRYGKANHFSALNFGDCMTYAVARLAGEPVLYTIRESTQTDLEKA